MSLQLRPNAISNGIDDETAYAIIVRTNKEWGVMSESGFVDVDGGQLFYVRDGAGPALVLAHGAPNVDHRMWADQVGPLSQRHTIVRCDLRGYGRSSLPGEPYRHCDDLAALVSALGLDRVVLVGMSFGAAVALDTALAFPGIANGLILAPLAPLLGWTWIEGFPLAPALRLAGSASTQSVVDAILDLPMNDAARERSHVRAALQEMGRSYSGWHLMNRDPGEWAVPNALDRLSDVHLPTLVITGDRDVLDVRMIGDRVAHEVPNATQLVLPGVGHNPNMEEPVSFNRACIEFLDHLEPMAPPGSA